MRGFFAGERWNKWNADDADRTDWSKDLEQSGPQITQMEAIRTDWIAAGNQNKWNEDKTDRNKDLEQDLICKTSNDLFLFPYVILYALYGYWAYRSMV